MLQHIVLTAAVLALAGAGWRLAALTGGGGLERVLATAVFAAAAAVIQTLLLGLVGWSGSTLALAIAAGATWGLAQVALPPEPPPGPELGRWWRGLSQGERAGLGGIVGLGAAWTVWLLRYPATGVDVTDYHLPQVVGWTQAGDAGSVLDVVYGFHVGNYPVTNETLLAWGVGISHSFVWVSLLAPAALALAAAAGWSALRRLGVDRAPAAVAVAAVCVSPLALNQLNTPNNDLAALAWLLACSALCAGSPREPRLLAPALVAAGLSVGTKTYTLPFVLVPLGVAGYASRASLRPLRGALALAAGGALAVGGVWYFRNLFSHGSPFWPLLSAPWGDARPAILDRLSTSLLEAPHATLSGRVDRYLDEIGGGLVLLAPGALLSPIVTPTRRVVAVSSLTAAALLAWAASPYTGAELGALSTTRYLLPATALGALALALAAGARRRRAVLALAALLAALGWDVFRAGAIGYPRVPSAATLVVGAALGVGAAFLPLPDRLGPWAKPAAALATLAAGVALAAAADGYVSRQPEDGSPASSVVAWFDAQPGFGDGSRPVATAPSAIGSLAGDRLKHRLTLIPAGAACAPVGQSMRGGWVVLGALFVTKVPAKRCVRGVRPVFSAGALRVYSARLR